MAKTETSVSNLKINRGTYAKIQENINSIGENELIITTDKTIPVPTTSDSGKVVAVNSSGEYELSSGGTATGVSYLTTAPSSANTDGDLKFVVLSSEPSTKYDGYLYLILDNS